MSTMRAALICSVAFLALQASLVAQVRAKPLLRAADVKRPNVLTDAEKKQGFKLVSLTNSSNYGVKTQFENAQLTDFFEARYSIEDIQIYKPDLRAYEWALANLGVKPEEALMVAAHGWDVAGAKAAGMQTAFVARPGKALYPLAQKPDYIVRDLGELVEKLSQ